MPFTCLILIPLLFPQGYDDIAKEIVDPDAEKVRTDQSVKLN